MNKTIVTALSLGLLAAIPACGGKKEQKAKTPRKNVDALEAMIEEEAQKNVDTQVDIEEEASNEDVDNAKEVRIKI